MERAYMSTDKVKDTWDSNSFRLEGDPSSGLTWPPKNYSCSFCKREFRSAQALGGHMNVHRRDRARLRQLSSWVFECSNHKSNSNPNPNFSPQHSSSSLSPLSPSAQFLPHSHTHISFVSRSLSKASNEEKKPMMECPRLNQVSPQCGELEKMKSKRSAVPGVGEVKSSYAKKCEVEALKKGESISLDLEMGFKGPKEALDLELRLGYL